MSLTATAAPIPSSGASEPIGAPAAGDLPTSHRNEAIALDRLGSTLGTAPPGSLVLAYGPSGADCDAAARIAANVFAYGRRASLAADAAVYPAVVVDAHFDRYGVLDLRVLFADIGARLGAPAAAAQVPPSRPPAAALWARGRRQQLREHADYFLAAVNACRGRSVEVVVVTHLGRRGLRTTAAIPGDGTETLTQFAAAAGVILVLSGGFEVLDHRTTAAPVTEIHFPRYRPTDPVDRAEFARVAAGELARLDASQQADEPDVINYLLANTLGSVATLRGWVDRAAGLLAVRPAGYTCEDVLAETVPQRLHALKAAAERVVAAERRLALEAAVTVDDVSAILEAPTLPASGPVAADETRPARPGRNYADPRVLRPGERRLEDDPVGETDVRIA